MFKLRSTRVCSRTSSPLAIVYRSSPEVIEGCVTRRVGMGLMTPSTRSGKIVGSHHRDLGAACS